MRASLVTRLRLVPLAILTAGLLACEKGTTTPAEPDPISRPAFTITSPTPAAMLDVGTLADEPITVTGRVCDGHYPIASLTVAGQAVSVSGSQLCESFSVTVASGWGMTLVTGTATNTRGHSAQLAQSFLRSPEWYAPAAGGSMPFDIKKGMAADLGQAMVDDGARDPVDDFATLLELAANGADLNALLPTTLASVPAPAPSCPGTPNLGYRVTRTSGVRHNGFTASQQLTGSRLILTLELHNPEMDVRVDGYFNGCLLGLQTESVTGQVSATLVRAVIVFEPDPGAATPGWRVASGGITRSVTGPAVDVNFSAFALVNSIVSDISTATLNVVNVLFPQVVGNLGTSTFQDLADDLLAVFNASDASAVDLPGGAWSINVTETPDLAGVDDSTLVLGKSLRFAPVTTRTGPTPARGAIRYPIAQPHQARKVEYGISLKGDVINMFLWSAWRAGAFDRSTFEPLGCPAVPGGVTLRTFAGLPPLLMPADGGTAIDLAVGEWTVEGTADPVALGGKGAPVSFTAVVSTIGRVTLEIADDPKRTLRATPQAPTTIGLAIHSIADPSLATPLRAALLDYLGCLTQRLPAEILGSLPIPGLNVGELKESPFAPGKKWQVEPGEAPVKGGFKVDLGARKKL